MSDHDQDRLAQSDDDGSLSEAEFRSRSRRSFLVGGAAAAAGAAGFRWVQNRPADRRIPDVLRTGLEVNESVWSSLFRDGAEAPTYSASKSSVLRVNGRHGLTGLPGRDDEPYDIGAWELRVEGEDGQLLGTHSLDDIKSFDRHEMVIQHKCIEGWSQITTWAGARFSDLAAAYDIDVDTMYVSLETPDRGYFVGLDMATAMHSQTLLAYEMHGGPLDLEHGAPLRLATPLKYGIKQIKRIGTIRFSNDEPRDYWAERGYSWYAGL